MIELATDVKLVVRRLIDEVINVGDLGAIDEHGALSIVGRKKEIIIRGGLNITPREIEEIRALSRDRLRAELASGAPDGVKEPR